jgi:hypothetical protein
MLLQILGPGCRRCTALAAAVETVDGEVRIADRVPSVDELRSLLRP